MSQSARPNGASRLTCSRYLANKCSIASRIDCFSDVQSTVVGAALHQQVEDRLKFYDTGVAPAKNADVMKDALEKALKEVLCIC